MSSFGENLQFYRKRENMTQEQLADQLAAICNRWTFMWNCSVNLKWKEAGFR